MLSSDKVVKGAGADEAGEAEVEAKEEIVAARELVVDSNSVAMLLEAQSKLKRNCMPSSLAAAIRRSNSCMYSTENWCYAVH